MNKIMDTSKHPTKGICTSKIELIHQINDINRRLARVRTVPKNRVLICSMLCLLPLEDSYVFLTRNSQKEQMWTNGNILLFSFSTKSILQSNKTVPQIVRTNPRNLQATKG